MSPLSDDPQARERQLANLRNARPAPRGNRNAERSGAYASVASERVAVKFDALAEVVPLREHGELPLADAAMLRLAAEAMCRLEDVGAYFAEHGLADPKSKRTNIALLEAERRLRAEVASHLEALGMSARSRARLGVDLRAATVDLATAMSEPDPAIRAKLLENVPGLREAMERGDES